MTPKFISFVLILCTQLLLMPSLLLSASFDCSKAQTTTEKVICSDRELSLLDEELSRIYLQIKELEYSKNQEIQEIIKN